MTGTGCNKKHWTKVYHENDGSGPNIKKNVKPGGAARGAFRTSGTATAA